MSMNRLETSQKTKEATTYKSYNKILAKESIAYLFALASIEAVGILPKNAFLGFLPGLQKIFAESPHKTCRDKLVSWLCSSGEMRNHQAVTCHCDGNKYHPYKLYSLYHRANCEKQNGFLYLPLDSVVVEIECDEDLMVCNLTNTPHVADKSRNEYIFSQSPWTTTINNNELYNISILHNVLFN